MEPDNPIPPLDPTPPLIPPPEEPRGEMAVRALFGFLAYVLVGWMSLQARVGLTLVLALIVGAIVLAVQGKWRGFALGVFIGVGLTLLAIGACFAIASGIK